MFRRNLGIIAILLFVAFCNSYGQHLVPVGQYHPVNGGTVGPIAIQGQYAYLVCSNGMEIVNISNPGSPQFIGLFESNGSVDVATSRNYAYIFPAEGFYRIDVNNPYNPIQAGYYSVCCGYNFFIYSRYAFISNQFQEFEIVDISAQDSLTYSGYFDSPGPAFDFCVVDTLVYIADCEQGLTIYDLSMPLYPGYVGRIRFNYGCIVSVSVRGNYAYAVWQNGNLNTFLSIVDVSDPTQPESLSTYIPIHRARNIYLSGEYAFLTEDDYGLEVINISDPSGPFYATSYDTPGRAFELIADGDYIYVDDWTSFLIFRFDPTGIEDNNENLPAGFSFSQNYPNPFNASTTISYSLPTASEVKIDIFDILGRKIETLVGGLRQPGNHQEIWDASDQGSGVYFYRISAGDIVETKKMVLLK